MKQLLNWFRRPNLERDLDRELRYHFDRRVSDLIARGASPNDARRQATLELGGFTQVSEEVRDVWLTRWLRDFVYDLRFSLRAFGRSPSFTVTAVLSLALGIGATTAIYSLVDQVLLHALPVRDPARLVLIDWKGDFAGGGFGSWNLMSYPICRDLQQQDRFFDGVLCRAAITVNLAIGSDPKPAAAELVSGSYFATLGVTPALGRVFTTADDQTPGASPIVVVSHDFWNTQLAAAHDVIGRKLLVNHHPMTIVGVAAAGFRGIDVGQIPSFWIPASMAAEAIPSFIEMLDHRSRWMQILGRLKPGMSREQVQAGLQPWFKSMLDADMRLPGFPIITPERRQLYLASTLQLTPAPQGHSGLRRSLSQPLWVLLAATAMLLGLACLNVAGLFLARGSAREREISTRLALGASRARVGRQLLADSVLLAIGGGLVGVLLAPLAMRGLVAFLPTDAAANGLHSGVDLRLLLFAFLISLAAGLLSGFAPAVQAGRRSLVSSLRERGGGGGSVRLRKLIVTVQIAFTLILVISAALFARTLNGLITKGPGFNTFSLVSFGIDPLRNGYTRPDANRLVRRIYEEVRTDASIQTASVVRFQLLNGGSWSNPMTIQSNERVVTDRNVQLNAITPDFFATIGVKMIAGRNFDQRDSLPDGRSGARSVIVNEAFVRRYMHGREPLGAVVCQGSGPDAKPSIPIIGVVADFSYRGLREESEQAYFSFFESDTGGGNFYVRTRVTPTAAFQSVRDIIRNADPSLPISYFRTLDEQVNRSLNTERMLTALSGCFAGLALLLSLVGLYGVMSFVLTQRTREIGIRLALGATGGAAAWLVLRDALIMIATGTAFALPCVAILGHLVESQLFGVKPTDPFAIAAATLVLTTSALGAALLPACRASTVDPIDALRFE